MESSQEARDVKWLCIKLEDDIQSFREAFSLFDNKGDEKIQIQSFGDVVRALGLNPTETDLQRVIKNIKEERISFEQFLPAFEALSRRKQDSATREDFIEGLKVFDRENNGQISSAELRHLLTTLGERLTDEEVEILLSGYEDKNGNVNYEEWINALFST